MLKRAVKRRTVGRRAFWPAPAWLVLAVLALLAVALANCRSDRPVRVDQVVKIGLVAPFEGRHREIGYDVIYSARLAIRQANQLRGPGRTKVALVAVDDFGDPDSARESAAAMAIDPGIVAVIGHWLPETTAAAKMLYNEQGLPFVAAGDGPLGPVDPAGLDETFLQAYADVTPFDETAGPYAGSAYDGLQLILAALGEVEASGGEIERSSVGEALDGLSVEGLAGTVWKP